MNIEVLELIAGLRRAIEEAISDDLMLDALLSQVDALADELEDLLAPTKPDGSPLLPEPIPDQAALERWRNGVGGWGVTHPVRAIAADGAWGPV